MLHNGGYDQAYLGLFDLDALQRRDPERQQFVIFVVWSLVSTCSCGVQAEKYDIYGLNPWKLEMKSQKIRPTSIPGSQGCSPTWPRLAAVHSARQPFPDLGHFLKQSKLNSLLLSAWCWKGELLREEWWLRMRGAAQSQILGRCLSLSHNTSTTRDQFRVTFHEVE